MTSDAFTRFQPLRKVLLFPAALVAVAAAGLDVVQWLGAAPLWVDEEMIALNIRDRGFAALPGPLWLGQGAPLGWLFVQRGVLLTLGSSELSLRFIPLLFGLATLATAVWVGQRWMKPPAAVLFVLLCAISEWLSQYRFELKHYSADAFFALLLPAMAVWATEENDPQRARDRWANWWITAALAQWFAFGALLVTPTCAMLLAIFVLTRFGVRDLLRFATTGILWFASFGVHYLLSLRYTSNNAYLRTYWADYLAPTTLGLFGTVRWIFAQLDDLARDPGGTSLAVGLWGCAVCGFAFCRRPLLAAAFSSLPLTAFLLSALRLVPLNGRLALWIVPALYLGVALLFDAGLRHGQSAWRTRRWPRFAAAMLAATAALLVSGNVLVRGARSLDLDLPREVNRGLSDRQAVAWLMARHEPGDVILSTQLGWPAIWWYGRIPIDRRIPGGFMRDGSVMYETAFGLPQTDCRQRMYSAFEKYRRVLVHVGFPDTPKGFSERLVNDLSHFGTVVERGFFADSRTAVVELHTPDAGALTDPLVDPQDDGTLRGCVEVYSARRW
jgi:hypothetical protein